MILQAVPSPAQKGFRDAKGPFIASLDAVAARPPDRSTCNHRCGKPAGGGCLSIKLWGLTATNTFPPQLWRVISADEAGIRAAWK
jgi:hypothetical protein